MKTVAAAVVLMVGGLSVAGEASAHHEADVVGALIGGAVLGAVVSSALSPAPAVVYQTPAYVPVYQAPVYQQPTMYAELPPGYCYDQYRGAYVPCGPAPATGYGYAPQARPGW